MFKLNTMTQLLTFFLLAVAINLLNLKYILLILVILLIILILNKSQDFLRALRRFRWFFLVMMVIFAFNTPGEHIAAWPLAISQSYSPTYEGLQAGLTQLLRIVVMLAGLSLILALNTKQQLISGFYFLFSPLKYLGVKVERFAARLWLTLHYVEQQRAENAMKDLIAALKNMTAHSDSDMQESISVTFELPIFSLIDYMFVLLVLVLFSFCVIKGFA